MSFGKHIDAWSVFVAYIFLVLSPALSRLSQLAMNHLISQAITKITWEDASIHDARQRRGTRYPPLTV